ncbi:hypothetical protein WICPIJ_007020, partial [Wickerhamomyces pijperi]
GLIAATASEPSDIFQIKPNSLINEQCCDLTYQQINTLNNKIRSKVHRLINEDYFKHYQFQLEMNCPFFECQSICFSPGCQLDLDVHSENFNYDVADQGLGDINEDSFLDSLCPKDEVIENPEDWCDLVDPKDGVIIDLSKNPERFTGYVPTPEKNIWGMIYQNQLDGECPIEQEVFFDIISGFHSSVSTHLSNEYYNNESNTWEPNLELFNFKVGNYPERISNIYFNYSLMLRSVLKIYPFLKNYQFNQFQQSNDIQIKKQIKSIVREFPTGLDIFNEKVMFRDVNVKEDFKMKFKNVTRLMDCVTCDRCRLWGKIQSTGYATALKILFNDNMKDLKQLKKVEIASLFNTFDRLTKSIESIENFNKAQAFKDMAKQAEVEYQSEPQSPVSEPNIGNVFDESFERDNATFYDLFKEELNAVWDALKFIFQSYIDLPYNLKNYLSFKIQVLWNEFIGTKDFNSDKLFDEILASHTQQVETYQHGTYGTSRKSKIAQQRQQRRLEL